MLASAPKRCRRCRPKRPPARRRCGKVPGKAPDVLPAAVAGRGSSGIFEGEGMMHYMFLPYKRFMDFSGRSRPKEYWLYVLFYCVQVAVAMFIDIQFLGADYTSYSDFGDGGFSAS